jgi:hypothetical protein
MQLSEIAQINEQDLKVNSYPGRGIITGKSPDGKSLVQVYWIMGRSTNSRNRVFLKDGEFVRTKAYDEKALTDPSLIIYYPLRNEGNCHIVTNGDQTDTIHEYIKAGKAFEQALMTRTFEPDEPNFTPRISGMVDLDKYKDGYVLSILKSQRNNPSLCQRNFFFYETSIPGFGHCIHTYAGDGNPLPSFAGEPYTVRIFDSLEENAQYYWNLIDNENKVSLLVKKIDIASGKFDTTIINKHS